MLLETVNFTWLLPDKENTYGVRIKKKHIVDGQ